MSVYKRGEPWPLEVFPYEQILSFGAPLPNAYKITVEARELLFETRMVRTSRSRRTNGGANAGKIELLLLPSAGHGRRQADEGLHQHDREEALQQLPVGQQPRQPVQRLVNQSERSAAPRSGAQEVTARSILINQNETKLIESLKITNVSPAAT